MKSAYCPYCNNHTYVDDRDWGLTIRCEAPRCERFFLTGSPTRQPSDAEQVASVPGPARAPSRRVAAPAPVPTRPEPALTGPHPCQVCGGHITQPTGRRRATILHQPDRSRRPELVDNCRTDIYAAIYRCPDCRGILETPRYQWGLSVTCPHCGGDLVAPHDDVLHRHEGDAGEGPVFQFSCPACDRSLHCDTHRQGRPTRDLPVVCIHCHHLIAVPGSGAALHAAPTSPSGPERRCGNPACGRLVPANCDACPLCRAPFASSLFGK